MSLDLTSLRSIAHRSRTTHIAWDGLEVQKQFYVDPFTVAPAVVEALQGSVFQEADKTWVRRLPAVDPYYPYCYCNEALIDQVDPEKQSMAISPALGVVVDEDEPDIPNVINYDRLMSKVNTVGEEAAGGAFITAHYRPLISALVPPLAVSADPGPAAEAAFALQDSKMFDWIDPQWLPGVKTVAWPDGMGVIVRHGFTGLPAAIRLPKGVADQVTVPITEFSIRRLLVGRIPWKTISSISNCVNHVDWPTNVTSGEGNIRFEGLFKEETLKFDGAEIVEHYSPASDGGFWYEIIYHFQWLHLEEPNVYDANGRLDPRGVVTWNHALVTPEVGLLGAVGLTKRDPGWYIVNKFDLANWAPWAFGSVAGTLYKIAPFDQLFDLQAP